MKSCERKGTPLDVPKTPRRDTHPALPRATPRGRSAAQRAKRLNIFARTSSHSPGNQHFTARIFKNASKLPCQAPNSSKSTQQTQETTQNQPPAGQKINPP